MARGLRRTRISFERYVRNKIKKRKKKEKEITEEEEEEEGKRKQCNNISGYDLISTN